MRSVAFRDCHVALLVGARPRGPGMERKDLLLANAQIFSAQGKALNEVADRKVRVLVVGNPANTNALIARANAPDLEPRNFTAMTRLDHNRALSQLADKTGTHVGDIRRMTIWGNHSATQYPDLSATPRSAASRPGRWWSSKWIEESFIPTVQQRGAAVIKARGASSAASAASAAIDHVRTWVHGTAAGDWVSMARAGRRQLRHRRRRHLFLSGHVQGRRLPDRAGLEHRRVQPPAHGRDATPSCARSATGVKDLLG